MLLHNYWKINMQAVILAAGKSSRFYPYSSLAHKSMVSLLGKPLLLHTVESLKKTGVTNILIIVSNNSSIPEELPSITGVKITFVVQEESLGMGNGLLAAKDRLEDSFLLLSGYHVDVSEFVEDLIKDKNHVVLLAKKDTSVDKFGIIEIDESKVLSLAEKPQGNVGEKLRVISIYHLTKSFVEFLKTVATEEYHFEKALDAFAKTNEVKYVETKKSTVSLKNTWDILAVKDYLLSRVKRTISSKAKIHKSAILEGEVVISDGVTILENAVVKGPCFLGENVIVGTNAILRNGVDAEKNVVIGATMEVKNSLLMEDVTTHTGFIGDSVIGKGSRLAAGFCSANVRFDRKNIFSIVKGVPTDTKRSHFGVVMGMHVDTGVNALVMPGIVVGNNVTVGPATVVMKDVEDNKLIYTKFDTVIKKNNE